MQDNPHQISPRSLDLDEQIVDGRRIIANVPYLLPKDLGEVNRLDFQHYMLRYAMRSNHLAPLQQPKSILDVACGTGRWAQEMAAEFPQAQVCGLDLQVPGQDTGHKVAFPANCSFVQGNVMEGLPFPTASFDYVHQRLLTVALPAAQWPLLLHELVRVTKPGGWIELVEVDLEMLPAGPAMAQLYQWALLACKQRGIDPTISRNLVGLLTHAGARYCQGRVIDIPVGKWGGRLGQMNLTDMNAIAGAMRSFITQLAHISPQDYDEAIAHSQREYEQMHTRVNFYAIVGQHP
ncbi:class I SAM-dependent methyltransferase [Dictyobacter aurantiacus]|uniref:Methyltransferase domain-containing protein n=1 Tax=Dictyobacter aurantiacus TaxID=1936993 RepID=A0A401ZKT2_9CHLR|nr:class I SAM-dependent methyltransferase [Dictyobacter aurantiacus]GCE07456.1 hypothetical protein KDAU_47850 [Dictyobacter aurantiacus]